MLVWKQSIKIIQTFKKHFNKLVSIIVKRDFLDLITLLLGIMDFKLCIDDDDDFNISILFWN